MFSAKVLVLFAAAVAVCYGAPKAHKSFNKNVGIEGGQKAKEGQFPFQVSIDWCFLDACEHICGGTIINENWILTGAGCTTTDAQKVIAGSIDLNDENDNKQIVDIDKTFGHPDFDYETGLGPNDIGLIKLNTPLTLNDNVKAAKLPKQGEEINGTLTVSGYGETVLPGKNKLYYASDLEVVSFEECNAAITMLIPDSPTHLDKTSNVCTLNEKSNNCAGDEGGPLSQDGKVVGTVSWFINPCGTEGAPNVYTNIASFVDWINETMTANS